MPTATAAVGKLWYIFSIPEISGCKSFLRFAGRAVRKAKREAAAFQFDGAERHGSLIGMLIPASRQTRLGGKGSNLRLRSAGRPLLRVRADAGEAPALPP